MDLFAPIGRLWSAARERAFERRVARMQRRCARPERVVRIAAQLIDRKRFEEADELLEAALRVSPTSVDPLEAYAMSAHVSAHYELA